MQTTEPVTTTSSADDLDHALALVTDQVRALADPIGAVDTIVDGLEKLYAQGADADALADIQAGGEQLLALTDASTQALRGAVDLAQRIKRQRDQVQQALSNLKRAIVDVDTDVPEVAYLSEAIEELVRDEAWEYMLDTLWEDIVDDIVGNTGLNYSETWDLLDLLRDSGLDDTHPAWSDLRTWMAQAHQAQEEAE